MIRKISKSLLLLGSAAGLAMPLAVHAKDGSQAPAHSGTETTHQGDILVMARKREESLLDVPVAMTVLNAEQLEEYRTDDVYALTERVPGFVMGTQVSAIGPTPSLRGVGTGTLQSTIDQSVALNIDGVGFSHGLAFNAGLFDMEQVEVLRGPQSLYFGKNSTAGVISIRSRDPGDELDVIAGIAYEPEAREIVGDLIVSAPLTENLGVRLAGRFSDMDGFFKNRGYGDNITSFTQTSSRIPNRKDTFLRGTLLWDNDADFSARLKVNYIKTDQKGSGGTGQWSSCPDGTGANVAAVPFFGGLVAQLYGGSPLFINPDDQCRLDRVVYEVDINPDHPLYTGVPNGGKPYFESELLFGSLELNYDVTPGLTLSSVTGLQDLSNEDSLNGGNSGFAGPIILAFTEFGRKDFTQELRLTSSFDGPLNFMLGGYYQDASLDTQSAVYFLGPRPSTLTTIDIETVSLFGQLLWSPIDQIEFAAGARWNDENRHFGAFDAASGAPLPEATYGGVEKIGSNKVSPEISVTYRPADNISLFASYRKGYKSGSWDSLPRGYDLSYGDESVEGFEGGVKAQLLDRSLTVNLSAYSYKYKGLQVGANESSDEGTGVIVRTINAASADVSGVDFDLSWLPRSIEGLNLFANMNYNHARYNRFTNAPCWGGQTAAQGCNLDQDPTTGLYRAQDLSGRPLLRAPDFSATFGFSYDIPVANGDMIVSLGSSTQYSDKYARNILLRDDFFQDSFLKTSANIGIRDADRAWEVSFIGRNLNNKITAGACTNSNGAYGNLPGTIVTGSPSGAQGLGGVDEITCIAERGRELWLTLKLRTTSLFK